MKRNYSRAIKKVPKNIQIEKKTYFKKEEKAFKKKLRFAKKKYTGASCQRFT